MNQEKVNAVECKEKGNEQFKRGEYLQALNTFTKGIQFDANNSSLWGNRAIVYFKLGLYEKAIEDSKFAIELNPSLPRYYWCKGESHLKLGQNFLARLAFENGLRHDPCDEQIRTKLNERREGEPAKEGPFSDDLADKKKKAGKFKDEGNDFYKQKKFSEALEKYNLALQLDPAESIFYNNRAAAHTELHNYEDVVKDTEYAVVLERTNAVSRGQVKSYEPKLVAKAFMRRAVAYEKLGKYQEALEALEDGLREEDSPPMRERIVEIKRKMK